MRYCKNCKYYNWICNKVIGRDLWSQISPTTYHKIYASSFRDNKNNDCKYYKRKFWKFWVREKTCEIPVTERNN